MMLSNRRLSSLLDVGIRRTSLLSARAGRVTAPGWQHAQQCGVVSSNHNKQEAEPSRRLLHAPQEVRMGWATGVVQKYLPFVYDIVSSKARAFEQLAIGYCPEKAPFLKTQESEKGAEDQENSVPNAPQPEELSPGASISAIPHPDHYLKRCDDSWLEIILPFTEVSALRDSMVRSDGRTIRYGKLFELLDALAGDVAYRHCGGKTEQLTIVTASVIGMSNSVNIKVRNDLKLQGYLTYVGKSSMEVSIDMIEVAPNGDSKLVGNTHFIMVARSNVTGRSSPIFGLALPNDEARRLFVEGKNRVKTRREIAAESLSLKPPRPEEAELIHSLYLESRDLEKTYGRSGGAQDALIAEREIEAERNDEGNNSNSSDSSHSGEVCNVMDVKFHWMANTLFRSSLLMHPQDRNVHGKIFGGYMMKMGFEIAHITAMGFLGTAHPIFKSVDDIQFVKPVDVGSVIELESRVIYTTSSKSNTTSDDNNSNSNAVEEGGVANREGDRTQAGEIVVQVTASKFNLHSRRRTKTNAFTYIFRAPDTCGGRVPKVIPEKYDEFVLYLEGRRALDHVQ